MDFRIEHRFPTVAEYQRLRATTGWDMPDDATAAAGLERSLYAVCITHKGTVIGTGRVVGDGALYFYVQDVIVLPEYRGKGAGRLVMEAIETYLSAHAPHHAFVGLMAAEGVRGFYRAFGYAERDGERPGMFKVIIRQD